MISLPSSSAGLALILADFASRSGVVASRINGDAPIGSSQPLPFPVTRRFLGVPASAPAPLPTASKTLSPRLPDLNTSTSDVFRAIFRRAEPGLPTPHGGAAPAPLAPGAAPGKALLDDESAIMHPWLSARSGPSPRSPSTSTGGTSTPPQPLCHTASPSRRAYTSMYTCFGFTLATSWSMTRTGLLSSYIQKRPPAPRHRHV